VLTDRLTALPTTRVQSPYAAEIVRLQVPACAPLRAVYMRENGIAINRIIAAFYGVFFDRNDGFYDDSSPVACLFTHATQIYCQISPVI